MTFFRLFATALAMAAALPALAQNPRVWLDTDRGPVFIELYADKAPGTTAHILEHIDAGSFEDLIFHRVVKDFIVQTGAFTAAGGPRNVTDTVDSERENGLLNTVGTVAIALSFNQAGEPEHDSGTIGFFVNLADNIHLDGDFTVFGKVVYGMSVIEAMEDIAIAQGTVDAPRAAPVLRRMVEIQGAGFPIMPLHTAAWHDPAQSHRGLSVEVTTAAGQPTLVVYWYERVDGEQVWMTGAAPFAYGATEVTVPLVLTSGGQFGAAYDPSQVVLDPDFGTLTVRFTDCDTGSFDYATGFGSGTLDVQRLTMADVPACPAN
jgi:cyclophilin family peptidyl-prolyl cis-trans isomerase